MNILAAVILAILLFSLLLGYKRGFLKTVLSLVSWIIVLIACSVATPMVKDMLIQQTDIEVTIQAVLDAKIDEIIKSAIEEAGIGEVPEGLPDGMEFKIPEELMAALPEEIKNMLLNSNLEGGLLEGGIPEGSLIDTAAIAESVVGMIALLAVMISVRIGLIIVELILGIAAKLPLIGPMDKVLGLVCGAGKGLIWCWLVLAIISVLALTGINTELAGYIAESQFLTWLQENNIILNLLAK